MNVLIITNQLIDQKDGCLFCSENVYDIFKRFSYLGRILTCAVRYNGVSSNKLESRLSNLIKSEDVFFVNKSYFFPIGKTRKIIESCVKQADLIIGYIPCANAYGIYKLAHKYQKKYMAYVVGCAWDAYWNHGFLGKIIAPYVYFEQKKCLKNSDYALYVTKKFLQKRYPCHGITCGCSDVRITELDGKILDKRMSVLTGLPENAPLKMVTIANYSVKYKGQHYVISALAELKKIGITRFHYYLVGGGDKERLEKLAKQLDVAEQVHFEGIVPHSEIFEKLDEMHIYIQPSLQEGLPRSVVEAMSRGLTCICADTAAMPEMVEPEYIVQRKSVDDIASVLRNMTVEKMIGQAKRNFKEAKKYEETILNQERNHFFNLIRKDILALLK